MKGHSPAYTLQRTALGRKFKLFSLAYQPLLWLGTWKELNKDQGDNPKNLGRADKLDGLGVGGGEAPFHSLESTSGMDSQGHFPF